MPRNSEKRNSIDALVSDIRSKAVAPLADARARSVSSSGVQSGFGGFGGGSFGGGGHSSEFGGTSSSGDHDWVENVPLVGERSFSDAYSAARKAGRSSFSFGGRLYSTDYDPDAKVGRRKVSVEPVANMRNVYDSAGKIIRDSTRIEPYVGQIPGRVKREK